MTTTRPEDPPGHRGPSRDRTRHAEPATLSLRPAVAEDLEWIVELRAATLRDDLERLGRYDEVRVRRRMRDGYSAEHTRVIVVDGDEVGCVAVRPERDVRWVEHFYVAPHAQGRGIGGRVLRAVLAQQDPRPLRLDVLRGSPAQRLYERHGFVVDGEDGVDVFMTRRPGPPSTSP